MGAERTSKFVLFVRKKRHIRFLSAQYLILSSTSPPPLSRGEETLAEATAANLRISRNRTRARNYEEMVEGGARGLLPDNSAGRKQELSCNEGTREAQQPPPTPSSQNSRTDSFIAITPPPCPATLSTFPPPLAPDPREKKDPHSFPFSQPPCTAGEWSGV